MRPVAIITGASRGIGKSIALELAKYQYNFSLVARDRDNLRKIEDELSRKGAEVLSIPIDLADETVAGHIVDQTIRHFGKIDVLINNAGIALNKPILESDISIWNKIFSINVRTPYFLCQKSIPHIKKSQKPVIINMGSVVDHKGYINQSIYAASKHALAGFTSVLAKEVQRDGIRVHLISPGGVHTDMVTGVRPDLDTGELIAPEEIANLVAFLCNYSGKGTIDQIKIRRFNSLPFD